MPNAKKPQVVIVTGPPAVGKTAAVSKLAKRLDRCAVIEMDLVRHMVVSGFARPWPRNREAFRQMDLGFDNVCKLARNFLSAGFNVVIDDVVAGPRLSSYRRRLRPYAVKVFLLMAKKETLKRRDSTKPAKYKMGDRVFKVHDFMSKHIGKTSWQVVDTDSHSAERVARLIVKSL